MGKDAKYVVRLGLRNANSCRRWLTKGGGRNPCGTEHVFC